MGQWIQVSSHGKTSLQKETGVLDRWLRAKGLSGVAAKCDGLGLVLSSYRVEEENLSVVS